MFGVGGGVAGFLLLHLPLWPAAFWGLVEARAGTTAGRVAALVVSAAGLAVFAIHTWFLRRGRPEFRAPCPWRSSGGACPCPLPWPW